VLKGSTQARSQVLRFGGNKAFLEGQDVSYYYMFKKFFLGTDPECPPGYEPGSTTIRLK